MRGGPAHQEIADLCSKAAMPSRGDAWSWNTFNVLIATSYYSQVFNSTCYTRADSSHEKKLNIYF